MNRDVTKPDLNTDLIDVGTVAEKLRCSTRHVHRMANAGRIPPPIRLGHLVRWPHRTGDPKTGIEDWISAGCPRCRKG